MSKQNSLIVKARGLNTQPNELDVPEGSLRVAENVEITRDNVVQLSPGFADYSSNMPDFEPQQLFAYGGTLYAHHDGGIWYHDGSNWLRKGGTDLGRATDFSYANGKLYTIDSTSYAIWSLDLTTGEYVLVAGRPGTSGTTDGTGAAARFTALKRSWFDGTSTIYVTDQHAIRTVNITTGVVTTVCGAVGTAGDTNSAGTLARFTTLTGITGDGTNLYVNDLNTNGKIKKIPISSYLPTTLATPGVYVGASRMAYDGSTYVYYKSSATVVQKCDKSSGATSTFLTVASNKAVDLCYLSSYLYYSTNQGGGGDDDEIRRAAVADATDSFVTLLDNSGYATSTIYVDASGSIYFSGLGTSSDVLMKAYPGFGASGGNSGGNTIWLLYRTAGGSLAVQPSGKAQTIIAGPD